MNNERHDYDNVYLDRGIVKPIVTSPAKSSEIQIAKVKQLSKTPPRPAPRTLDPDDVAFQRISRYALIKFGKFCTL